MRPNPRTGRAASRQLELTLETAGEPIGNAQLAQLTAVGDR